MAKKAVTPTHDQLRRGDAERQVPAERAITAAMQAVEAMGADLRLTAAVTLLRKARDEVSDFTDGVEQELEA